MARAMPPRSVARAVACCRGFYRFLAVTGGIARQPGRRPARAARVEALPQVPLGREVDRLLARPDVTTPRGLRDRALIELLYATGLRVSELRRAAAADLNLEAGYLTCTGKGSKQRLVPIGDEAAAWVARYLQEARPRCSARRPSPRLFVNARGGGALTRVGLLEDPQGLRAPGRAAARASARTCCATRSPRTCSSAAPTCARSR